MDMIPVPGCGMDTRGSAAPFMRHARAGPVSFLDCRQKTGPVSGYRSGEGLRVHQQRLCVSRLCI